MPILLLLLMLFAAPSAYAAEDAAPKPITSSDIVSYLDQMTGWSRAVSATDQLVETTREAVIRDKLHHDAQAILQKSFAFARAEAAIVETEPAAAGNAKANEAQSRRERLSKIAADADKHVADLQSQLSQPGLTEAQREKLAGALKLAQARQSLLQTFLGIISSEGGGTLLDQINTLSRTVIAESSGQPKAITEPLPVKSPQIDNGIFSLSDGLLALSRKRDAIDTLFTRTQNITDATRNLITSTRAGLKDALAQGDALSAGNDAAGLAAYRQAVDKLVEHYKQLSAAIIPLGEIHLLLENTQQNLQDWNRIITGSQSRLLHQLLIRLSILALSIAIPLICSSLVHRAIYRYVKEVQKRKQLDLARRILLIFALILVILANFMTEFGSLATFAGFITAGLAVALQTVLVSLVAHSLYFGRYGIHVGDRIRVTDVTGEVIQLGMLRLYMRELKETDKGMEPTGKIVAFPNSVLFQPSAFYKYVDTYSTKS